jgi:hypothetical protein
LSTPPPECLQDPLPVFSEFHRLLQPNGYMIFTQRENLYTQYDYQKVLEQLEAKELIKLIMMSEPTNYLPNRKNYIGSIHHEHLYTAEDIKKLPEIIYHVESFDRGIMHGAIPSFLCAIPCTPMRSPFRIYRNV